MLSAVSVLLSSPFGEITSAKDISWDLEVGRVCSPIKNKTKNLHFHRL